MGSPTFLSLPHFFGADPYYLSLVDGLKPEKEKHDFFFTLEEVNLSNTIVVYATKNFVYSGNVYCDRCSC